MTQPETLPAWTWGIDCESAYREHVPHAVPVLWPYSTGTSGIYWPPEYIAEVHAGMVITVDQGFDASGPFVADEFDIEARALTIDDAVTITRARAARKAVTRMYGGWEVYAQVSAGLAADALLRNVWWRIADWDLNEHEAQLALTGNIYAVQWASPTSNPDTLIPGTQTPLKVANADLSVMSTQRLTWRD